MACRVKSKGSSDEDGRRTSVVVGLVGGGGGGSGDGGGGGAGNVLHLPVLQAYTWGLDVDDGDQNKDTGSRTIHEQGCPRSRILCDMDRSLGL